jgi:hypothetical protein
MARIVRPFENIWKRIFQIFGTVGADQRPLETTSPAGMPFRMSRFDRRTPSAACPWASCYFYTRQGDTADGIPETRRNRKIK